MIVRTAVVSLLLIAGAWAQSAPTIEKAKVAPTSPASGKAMFSEYCAVCHGVDAKGHGPASPALKTQPSDLTSLAARNGGKFPEFRVYEFIKGSDDVPAHGSREMPVWGDVFNSMQHEQAVTSMRITNLTNYIKSLQQK